MSAKHWAVPANTLDGWYYYIKAPTLRAALKKAIAQLSKEQPFDEEDWREVKRLIETYRRGDAPGTEQMARLDFEQELRDNTIEPTETQDVWLKR